MSETWHGIVHSIVPKGIYVTIPRLLGGEVLGPCLSAVPDLVVGDRVVGAKIGDSLSDLIILTRAAIAVPDATVVHKDAEGSVTLQSLYLNGAATPGNKAVTQDGLDTKAPVEHRHPWADLDNVPATFAPSAHRHPWAELDDVPATFAPSAHTHPASAITDSTATGRSVLTAADPAAARTAIGAGTSSLVLGTTATTAMAGNKTFTKADVGLGSVDNTADTAKPVSGPQQTALNGKANTAHTHLWADLTDKPTTFFPSYHQHDWNTDLYNRPATFPPSTHTHPDATTTTAGFMSAADKTFLDAVDGRIRANDVDPWVALTLENAWVPYVGGGGYYLGIRARRNGHDLQIQGMVKSGAVGTVMATLPLELRPPYTSFQFAMAATGGTPRSIAYLTVGTSGAIVYDSGQAAPAFVNIELLIPLTA